MNHLTTVFFLFFLSLFNLLEKFHRDLFGCRESLRKWREAELITLLYMHLQTTSAPAFCRSIEREPCVFFVSFTQHSLPVFFSLFVLFFFFFFKFHFVLKYLQLIFRGRTELADAVWLSGLKFLKVPFRYYSFCRFWYSVSPIHF